MRINEKNSTSGMQSLQQNEAVFERSGVTCAYSQHAVPKIKPILIKPL